MSTRRTRERKLEDAIKGRIEALDDEELREKCLSLGLKPGPLTKSTRKGWVRRVTSKELEKSMAEKDNKNSAPKEEPAEDPFNFSADEEALTKPEGDVEQTTPAKEVAAQTTAISPEADDDFSGSEDGDESGEDSDSSESKASENEPEPEAEADTTPTAVDTTEMQLEDSKSPLDTTGVEMRCTIQGDEQEQSGKETSTESTGDTDESKPDAVVENKCCLGNSFKCITNYLCENAQDIIEFTVILLLAYFLYVHKDDIQPYFDASMKRIENVFGTAFGKADGDE